MNKITKYSILILLAIILPFNIVFACVGESTILPQFGNDNLIWPGLMANIFILLFVLGIIIFILFRKKKFVFYSLLIIFNLLPIFHWLPYIFSNNGKGWLIVVIISTLLFDIIFDYFLILNKKKERLPIYIIIIYTILFVLMWGFYGEMRPTFCATVSTNESNLIPHETLTLN